MSSGSSALLSRLSFPAAVIRFSCKLFGLLVNRAGLSTNPSLVGIGARLKPADIRTMILEGKGHLAHRKIGREFIYRPTQNRGQAGRSALGRVLDVFFGGSLENAVAAHLSDPRRAGKITSEELRRLSDLIEDFGKGD